MVCLTWNSLTLQIWQLQTAFGHEISSRQGRLTRALPRGKDVPLSSTGFLSAEHGIVQLFIGLRQCRIQSPFMILLFNLGWRYVGPVEGPNIPCFGSQICGDSNLTLIQVCFALEMLLQLLFKAISHFLGDKTNFWGTHGNANNYIMDTYIYILYIYYICVCVNVCHMEVGCLCIYLKAIHRYIDLIHSSWYTCIKGSKKAGEGPSEMALGCTRRVSRALARVLCAGKVAIWVRGSHHKPI